MKQIFVVTIAALISLSTFRSSADTIAYSHVNVYVTAQDTGQHGRLGFGNAGVIALLASDAAGQRGGPGLIGKGNQY